MNDINLMNVPADERSFCLTNYNACAEVTDKDGKRNFIDLPLLRPIFARTMEEAKRELAAILGVNINLFSKWDVVGDEDGFAPSICIGYKAGAMEAGYSFDVYMTVNTLYLV